MKKDLDYIFKKVSSIKVKIHGQYPEAMTQVISQNTSLSEEAEEDDDDEELVVIAEEKPTAPKTVQMPVKPLKSSRSQVDRNVSNVEYVQMEHSPDSGRLAEGGPPVGEAAREKSFDDSDNESSECTSDTGWWGIVDCGVAPFQIHIIADSHIPNNVPIVFKVELKKIEQCISLQNLLQ